MDVQKAEGLELQKYLLFQLDSVYFGFPIQKVLGIVPGDSLVSITNLPDSIPGVIRLHTKVIPVVDLRKRLSQGSPVKARPFLIAAVTCGKDGQWEVGITAHSVINVFEIPTLDSGHPLVETVLQDQFVTGLLQQEEKKIHLLAPEKVLFPNGPYFPDNSRQAGNKQTSPRGPIYG